MTERSQAKIGTSTQCQNGQHERETKKKLPCKPEDTQVIEGRKQSPTESPKRPEAVRGLVCSRCGCRHFRVIYTRAIPGGIIRRRRECRQCGRRVTTKETASP